MISFYVFSAVWRAAPKSGEKIKDQAAIEQKEEEIVSDDYNDEHDYKTAENTTLAVAAIAE